MGPLVLLLHPARAASTRLGCVIADRAGCQAPPVFAYARRLVVVAEALAACTMTTWVVVAAVFDGDADGFFDADADADGDG